MSRYYEISIEVENFNSDLSFDIEEAITNNWKADDNLANNDRTIFVCGRDFLCGGESEEEFAERITREIWKANHGYCNVQVAATCLEDLPCEIYNLDEDDYKRLTGCLPNDTISFSQGDDE